MNLSMHIFRVGALSILAALLTIIPTSPLLAAEARWRPLLAADPIDFETVDPLYRATIRRDGNIDQVVAELQAYAADGARPKRRRANALLVSSHLQWRHGQRKAAQASIEQALKFDVNADLALQQARLLEAIGDVQQAQRWYEQAFERIEDPRRQERLRLRMTFVDVGQKKIDALVRLARRHRDRAFRNRAAVALAVLNHYDEAIGLYEVYGEGSDRFRRHLRLAQWALAAGHAPDAQEEAWKAVKRAPLDRDRRYALSVLVDAYEMDDSLDKLLQRFEGERELSAEEQDTRVNLLHRLGRYEEAIDLYRQGERGGLSAVSRRRLLRMYGEAGRGHDMVAEYRELIAAEPAQVVWPEGLSQYLMEQSEREEALRVWRAFIDRNREAGVLLNGARAMARFGFDELAVAATEKLLAGNDTEASAALLFRFELNIRRGRTAEAEQTLARMDELLAPGAMERVELADAYERLKRPHTALKVMEALDRGREKGVGVDERMKMAWLYDSTGQREKALQVWKTLWNGNVNEAFRRLVEDRLVTLAAESGALGDLVVELETKLAAGTASKKDSALLIRIYTDSNDSASAVEVIREYFERAGKGGATDIEGLREQATVYRTLGRNGAFRRTTTRLLALDPDNAVDYLQSLVLNQLENGGADNEADKEQLKKWLAQLQATGGGAAGSEFEAGILVLAGLNDDAIATYRRALAENPDRSDNVLLLADLLKQNTREEEAIATLQYLIESAEQDDDFIVGVDGILNLRPGDKGIIAWAQRRVLERLTGREDKLYLYELLAELANEAENAEVYLSALENSLAYANSRRSHVLRELISATEEKSGIERMTEGGMATDAQPRRNLRYSRRLISLAEELPPEVYINMGRTFLKMNDPDNAADAFNLAVDRTGDDSLAEKTGDLFRNAGFNRQAAAQYKKALIADADNVSMMRKLGDVRARQGATAEANDLYLRGLLKVLQTLPLEVEQAARDTPPTTDSSVSYAYRQNYASLLAGFLYTLPSPGDGRFALIEQAFDKALADAVRTAGGEISKELAYYPRLEMLSRFARDAARRSGRQALSAGLDVRLLRHFGADQALVAELKGAAGQASPLRVPALLPSRQAATEAAARREYRRAIDFALFNLDQELAVSIYRDWARDLALGTAPAEGDKLTALVVDAKNKLDAARYASLCRYFFDLVSDRKEILSKLVVSEYSSLFNKASILLDMEHTVGRELMSGRQAWDIVLGDGATRQGFDLDYVMSKLAVADQVELLEQVLAASGPMLSFEGLRSLLLRPLTAPLAARVLALIKKGVQAQIQDGEDPDFIADWFANQRLSERMAPRNMAFIEQLEEYLSATFADVYPAGALKADALLALGREREALPFIIDVALSQSGRPAGQWHGGVMMIRLADLDSAAPSGPAEAIQAASEYLNRYADTIYPRYKTEAIDRVTAGLKDKKLTSAAFAVLMALEKSDPRTDDERMLRRLEELAEQYPDTEPVLAVLSQAYEQRGYTDLRMRTLERLVAVAPRALEHRKALFDLWQRFDHRENAVKTAAGRLADLSVEAAPDPTAGMMHGFNHDDSTQHPVVVRSVARIVALDDGGDVDQARNGLRSLLRMLPPPGSDWMDSMGHPSDGEGDEWLQYDALFDLDWNLATPPESTEDRFSREGKLLDKVIDHAFAVAELEAVIRTLNLDDIERNYPLYGLLAEAYHRHHRLPAEMRRLEQQARAGTISEKDTVLWLEMVARLPGEQIRALLPLIERTAGIFGIPKGFRQVLLGRLYALAGEDERAVGIYSAAVLDTKRVLLDELLWFWEELPPLASVAGLYADARQYLSPAALERLTEAILRIASPDQALDASGEYAQFVMWLLERNPDSSAALARLQALGAHESVRSWGPEAIGQMVERLARRQRHEEALALLRTLLQRRSGADQASGADQQQQEQQQEQRRGYRLWLGNSDLPDRYPNLDGSEADAFVSTRFASLLPSGEDGWAGGQAWLRQLSVALDEWVGQGAIDRDTGIHALAQVTEQLNQSGARQAALASAQTLTGLLAPYATASHAAATRVVSLLHRIEAPIDAALLKALIAHRRLNPDVLTPALRRVARDRGAAEAVALGEPALAYSRNDELAMLMRTLAGEAGRSGLLRQIDEQQKKEREVEKSLADNLNPPMVGGKIPDVSGRRLDGVEESIGDFAGKVVLLDFWATWCGPCIDSIPKMKALAEKYPPERFEILSISVDADVEEVRAFQESTPMPWANWHIGPESDILSNWEVEGFPTYILIGPDGTLLTRLMGWEDRLEALIDSKVRGLSALAPVQGRVTAQP